MDDVATMEIGDRDLATDGINSKLIYFVREDGCSDVALQGDRGPSGARGLKRDCGDKGPVGSRSSTGKRGVEVPVGSRGGIGARGEKVNKGDKGL